MTVSHEIQKNYNSNKLVNLHLKRMMKIVSMSMCLHVEAYT